MNNGTENDIPLGFGMALAMNEKALNAYGMLSDKKKSDLLNKAKSVNSKSEMRSLVNSILSDTTLI